MRSGRAAKSTESSLELFDNEPFEAIHMAHGNNASVEARGAIFTKVEVVEFILDLIGYTSDKQLYKSRILEPSVGRGDFLFPVVDRILRSIASDSVEDLVENLQDSVLSVEIHEATVLGTRAKLVEYLLKDGRFTEELAVDLSKRWIIHSDFLLLKTKHQFDFIVGNPPYVRQELIPESLLKEYRRKFTTIYDRADLYIPFIEHSLNQLARHGLMGFICADRWVKNKYGGPLRHLISTKFQLKYYVDMTNTNAFHTDVIAYPAITVFSRPNGGKTKIAEKPSLDRAELSILSKKLLDESSHPDILEIKLPNTNSSPWIIAADRDVNLLRKLETRFPLIEETGCKIGIGVATGADKVFIGLFDELEVEDDRKLPIVMTRDLLSGVINWRGMGIINPFNDDGNLVRLQDFPKMKKFFEWNRELLIKRHVAKNSPGTWYKTIDRIYAPLTQQKKLLIPDIKGEANIVYDEGKYYPHHNLYYITSARWNIKILQAILMSGIATFFVSKYSPQMRGGYLRFQAQYLRRIRLPQEQNVSEQWKAEVNEAIVANSREDLDRLIFDLYGLTQFERDLIKTK